MTRKPKSTSIIPIVIFIAFVALAGFGLAATGNLSNPFAFLSGGPGGGGRPANMNFTPPNNGANSTANTATGTQNNTASTSTQGSAATSNTKFRPDGEGGQNGNSITINWSQIGKVLFNLWYLCATTAVVIVIQKVGRFLLHRVRQRQQPVAA